MARIPYIGKQVPSVTAEGQGNSFRITIPSGVAHELEIEQGDTPAKIFLEDEKREVTFRFDADDSDRLST